AFPTRNCTNTERALSAVSGSFTNTCTVVDVGSPRSEHDALTACTSGASAFTRSTTGGWTSGGGGGGGAVVFLVVVVVGGFGLVVVGPAGVGSTVGVGVGVG